MIMAKFLKLLVFFLLLAGCSTTQFDVNDVGRVTEGPCSAPNRPSETVCTYAIMVTDEADGKDFALGVIPRIVVDDNQEQQKKRGKSVDYKNYPYEEKYPIRVKDLSKLKKGKIYILHSVPSDRRTFDNKLIIEQEVNSEEDLKKILDKNRYHPKKSNHY